MMFNKTNLVKSISFSNSSNKYIIEINIGDILVVSFNSSKFKKENIKSFLNSSTCFKA